MYRQAAVIGDSEIYLSAADQYGDEQYYSQNARPLTEDEDKIVQNVLANSRQRAYEALPIEEQDDA